MNINKTPTNISIVAFALIAIPILLTGCGQSKHQDSVEPKPAQTLFNFESDAELRQLKLNNALATLSHINHSQAAKIEFLSAHNHESMVEFVPTEKWNWSKFNAFGVALDISNSENSSVHLYVTVKDSHGSRHNRSFVVPANSSDKYVMELAGIDLNIETGIRSNPFSWQDKYKPIIWRYGSKNIDLTDVASISFKVIGVPENKILHFDNVELVEPKQIDQDYLVGLVDKYGQSTKIEFANKVSTDVELVKKSQQEIERLNKAANFDRSKFNGWKSGPKLPATGFYRVDKYQGKWTLVDPQGYLFYSNGIANVRMANTTTITGYDFDPTHIKPRDPGDLTPEDSIGLNTAPAKAWPTRKRTSDLRANMFTWLPEYDSTLGQYFGYRREVHSGVIEKGETFSFYQANLSRKYQMKDMDKVERTWRETTIKRMQNWGFTSFGNWIDPSFYDMAEYPYFANGWIIGDFKTVSSGNDYWSPLPDPFDPKFKTRAFITVEQIAKEVKNSPWCVGVFIDNEKSWGQMGSHKSQYGIPLSALALNSNNSPSKAHFSRLMKQQYNTIEGLNQSWQTNFESWSEFDSGVELQTLTDNIVADLSTMLYEFGRQYFVIVNQAMEQYMPNHLYMGVRFADWGMTPELRQAAAEIADVVSYNYYKEVINDDFWQFLAEVDKPTIIGEFHNGSLDSGLLNPGLIHASDQKDRGKKYAEYVNSAIDNPYFVGTHWFQYIDSPLTGRALDGENYNVGFVSVTDIPYQPLVDAASEVNRNLYQRRFNDKRN
ncbi:beta-galactosidase [Psychrosphaera sp. B3R10]|uniref:beta-galactosidase n=1 Tax=unclassified Psychrosphaera TaxID=2641570 RepID=UPI001C09591F|nr:MULTISPECIES: beta-galactosidase [unclassified Psychrosphaera]MBU2880832.1 beta-galactosidase [Psychrosphaera sp. I2R16]MBU2990949.1 beta-galactosidase [Psychrosphaera sp. B3R10]